MEYETGEEHKMGIRIPLMLRSCPCHGAVKRGDRHPLGYSKGKRTGSSCPGWRSGDAYRRRDPRRQPHCSMPVREAYCCKNILRGLASILSLRLTMSVPMLEYLEHLALSFLHFLGRGWCKPRHLLYSSSALCDEPGRIRLQVRDLGTDGLTLNA